MDFALILAYYSSGLLLLKLSCLCSQYKLHSGAYTTFEPILGLPLLPRDILHDSLTKNNFTLRDEIPSFSSHKFERHIYNGRYGRCIGRSKDCTVHE